MNLLPPAVAAEPHVEGNGGRTSRRPRRPALTPEEGRRADSRTIAVLERYGHDPRPATQTSLFDLESGTEFHLDETKARALFAHHTRRRAAEMALSFDAFSHTIDQRAFRLFGLRPKGFKGSSGALAQELARLSSAYDRCVGRLKGAGFLQPLLAQVHVRYDRKRDLWDVHIHLACMVDDENLDAVHIALGRAFSDPWQERGPIRNPGAVVNYMVTWVLDHREVERWPEHAVVEFWNLPRVRLSRPAGAFAAFRRGMKDKMITREHGKVVVRDRPAAFKVRKSSLTRTLSDDEARVVAVQECRVGGQKRRFAIVKRRRSPVQDTPLLDTVESRGRSRPVAPEPSRAGFFPLRLCEARYAPVVLFPSEVLPRPPFSVLRALGWLLLCGLFPFSRRTATTHNAEWAPIGTVKVNVLVEPRARGPPLSMPGACRRVRARARARTR